MNHYETADGKIVVDVMKYDVAPLFPLPDGSPSTKATRRRRLFRWTFDLSGKSNSLHGGAARRPGRRVPALRRALLHGRLPPRLDRRRPRRRSLGARAAQEGDQLTHYDLKTGKSADWQPGRGDRCGEPIFVPRAPQAAEGDGWVLSVVYRAAEERSDLAVFEATDIAKGPVALAHLSSRVPAGFHGNWRPGPRLVRSRRRR